MILSDFIVNEKINRKYRIKYLFQKNSKLSSRVKFSSNKN